MLALAFVNKVPLVSTAAVLLIAFSSRDSEQEGEVFLLRPAPAADPDAKGKMEIERANRTSREFEIELIDTVANTYTFWIEDGVAA